MLMLVIVGAVSVLALQKTKTIDNAYSGPLDLKSRNFEGVPESATDMPDIDVAG